MGTTPIEASNSNITGAFWNRGDLHGASGFVLGTLGDGSVVVIGDSSTLRAGSVVGIGGGPTLGDMVGDLVGSNDAIISCRFFDVLYFFHLLL